MQTDTNQTRHNVAITIPNCDSNVHTTIEESKPQSWNPRKIQRIKPTKVIWTEHQIYEYIPKDNTNSIQSIVPHFAELVYAAPEDEKINKIRITLANFTLKIKDNKNTSRIEDKERVK